VVAVIVRVFKVMYVRVRCLEVLAVSALCDADDRSCVAATDVDQDTVPPNNGTTASNTAERRVVGQRDACASI